MEKIVCVIGPGTDYTDPDKNNALELGKLIAEKKFVLLTGGRNAGVMQYVNQGAKLNNGVTIGILPGTNKTNVSEYVDIPVITGINNARNIINVLSADLVIACGIGPGTVSEIMFAIKSKKTVILFNYKKIDIEFIKQFDKHKLVYTTDSIETVSEILDKIKRGN